MSSEPLEPSSSTASLLLPQRSTSSFSPTYSSENHAGPGTNELLDDYDLGTSTKPPTTSKAPDHEYNDSSTSQDNTDNIDAATKDATDDVSEVGTINVPDLPSTDATAVTIEGNVTTKNTPETSQNNGDNSEPSQEIIDLDSTLEDLNVADEFTDEVTSLNLSGASLVDLTDICDLTSDLKPAQPKIDFSRFKKNLSQYKERIEYIVDSGDEEDSPEDTDPAGDAVNLLDGETIDHTGACGEDKTATEVSKVDDNVDEEGCAAATVDGDSESSSGQGSSRSSLEQEQLSNQSSLEQKKAGRSSLEQQKTVRSSLEQQSSNGSSLEASNQQIIIPPEKTEPSDEGNI